MVDRKFVRHGFAATALAFAVVGCMPFALAGQARAGAVDQGREIAEQRCARCHAIGSQVPDTATGTNGNAATASPHLKAPPFRVIATRYPLENLEEAFAEGIVVGHRDMPEFQLEPNEIAALLSFMASVAK